MRRSLRQPTIAIDAVRALNVLFTVVFPWIDRQLPANPVLD